MPIEKYQAEQIQKALTVSDPKQIPQVLFRFRIDLYLFPKLTEADIST